MTQLPEIDRFLTAIYRDILWLEEQELRSGEECDLTVTELHILDKIGEDQGCTMSEAAERLGVTLATLTAAANRLEKKGYLQRERSNTDRRTVYLTLTNRGRAARRIHDRFHRRLCEAVVEGMTESERDVLLKGLRNLNDFFQRISDSSK